jgi:hypothetical protein
MTIGHYRGDRRTVSSLRSRLVAKNLAPEPQSDFGEVVPNPVDILNSLVGEREVSEQALLDAVYRALCTNAGLRPGLHPILTFRLHQADLLQKASVNHVVDGHSMDFAWPAKRVGLMAVYTAPDGYFSSGRDDFSLLERGWVMLAVAPCSKTFDEQIARNIAVIKRIGPYRGILR